MPFFIFMLDFSQNKDVSTKTILDIKEPLSYLQPDRTGVIGEDKYLSYLWSCLSLPEGNGRPKA